MQVNVRKADVLFSADICIFSDNLRSAVLQHPEAHGPDVLRVAPTDDVSDLVPHADTVQSESDHSRGFARLLYDRRNSKLHVDHDPLDVWPGRRDIR